MSESTVPPGWPAQVRPPGAPDWERTAVAWLLDLCPPDYRGEEVLRRHPAVLARFAAHHVTGAVQAVGRGLATARHDLREVASPGALEASIAAFQRAQARLEADARAVQLVEEALRGRRFRPRL